MSYLIIGILFVFAVLQTIRKGPGSTFAYLYLPVLFLVSTVRPVSIEPLPDITSPIAVSYGTLLGMALSGRFVFFKLHLIDYLVVLCSVTIAITGYVNGEFWTLVSATGNETLRWLIPYYMARIAFREAPLRRHMGLTFCFLAMALGVIGIIEFRLFPLFFSRMLERLDMAMVFNTMVLGRYGFFRAMGTTEHPIDFGNVGLLLAGLLPALCVSGGIAMRDKRFLGGMAGVVLILISSMSFSSLAGSFAALCIFLALRHVRFSETFLLPGLLAAIIGGFYFTNHLLSIDLKEIEPVNSDVALDGSYYIRVLIIQNSWNSYGQSAGWLGYGDDGIKKEVLKLESVDNSYMLFLMRRGWIHLILRLFLACTIAFVAWRMLRRESSDTIRVPIAAFTAVLLGTMVSMYTVWFGFVYAVVWTCSLGMFVTMRQVLAERATAAQPLPATPYPTQRPILAQPVT